MKREDGLRAAKDFTLPEKKYELVLDDTDVAGDSIVLYRIRALRNFGDVKAGDLGGYVEKEENLSHWGLCWVYDNGWVLGGGRVMGNGKVFDEASVTGCGWVIMAGVVRGDTVVRRGIISEDTP